MKTRNLNEWAQNTNSKYETVCMIFWLNLIAYLDKFNCFHSNQDKKQQWELRITSKLY